MTGQRIFVFGSNLAGRHGKGAALDALRHHGAIRGQGIGRMGTCYAIPTRDGRRPGRIVGALPIEEIARHVTAFIEHALEHPEDTFDVSRFGCGNAGYTDRDMAPLLLHAPANCVLQPEWVAVLKAMKVTP